MGQNFIVINGKHYDAKTGKLLTSTPVAAKKAAPKTEPGKVLDGFSRRPAHPKPVTPAHQVHQKNEKSKTLMRGAVKKPANNKVHATAHAVGHQPNQTQPHAGLPANDTRIARASSVTKSSLISRFGSSDYTSDVQKPKEHKTVAHVPVKNAPPISEHKAVPLSSHANPFAHAIENATSHEQLSPKRESKRNKIARTLRVSPRTFSAGSMVLAGLLLGGFFVYQNIPNLAMKVAATRSGVHANLPGYKPAGFAINGPIKYSAGKISINYRSTTDDRTFAVTQSASEWNEETLLDNFVATERRAYQTYQDKGKTIYIYDDNNATWVDNGVWYQIEGASSLNSDQLLRIANSL